MVCIVFLSSFTEMAKPVQPKPMDCCKQSTKTCKDTPPKKNEADKDCNKPGCTMMFACIQCGFIVKEGVSLTPLYAANIIQEPVAHYKHGDVAGYYTNNWKPPQYS